MRKGFVVFGVILVLAGFIVALASAIPAEKTVRSVVATAPRNEWGVLGRFNEGDMLSVEFVPPDLDELVIMDSTLKLLVEITSSAGGKTGFEMEFRRGFGGNTILYNLTLVLNEDGLTVSDSPTEVGGVVLYTGDYLANVTDPKVRYIMPGEDEFWAPGSLQLVKFVVDKEYPYLSVLPIGVVLAVVGGLLSLWGLRSSKRKLQSRKKTH